MTNIFQWDGVRFTIPTKTHFHVHFLLLCFFNPKIVFCIVIKIIQIQYTPSGILHFTFKKEFACITIFFLFIISSSTKQTNYLTIEYHPEITSSIHILISQKYVTSLKEESLVALIQGHFPTVLNGASLNYVDVF